MNCEFKIIRFVSILKLLLVTKVAKIFWKM